MTFVKRTQEELTKFFNTQTLTPAATVLMIETSARIMNAPAKLMLDRVGLSSETSKPFQLLDQGCGTGLVAALVQDCVDKDVLVKSRMLCADISEQMVEVVKGRNKNLGWISVEEVFADAMVGSILALAELRSCSSDGVRISNGT
jgi:SAM-dependent methyltransferase